MIGNGGIAGLGVGGWLWMAAVLASSGAEVPGCSGSVGPADAPSPRALEIAINHDRIAAGLAPVRLRAELCRVASARAGRIAVKGTLEEDETAIADVSHGLYAEHYRAQRWNERPVLRRGSATRVLAAWWQSDPAGYRAAVFGDVADLGVGRATLDATPLTVLLFAAPRHAAFLREAAALGTIDQLRAELVTAANAERARAGLPPLARAPALDAAAQAYAEDLVRRNYYDHVSLDGETVMQRLARAGFAARAAAENLARGPFSASEAVTRWMGSSGHRANLLSTRVDRIGAGVVLDEREDKEQFTFVLDFAAGDSVP